MKYFILLMTMVSCFQLSASTGSASVPKSDEELGILLMKKEGWWIPQDAAKLGYALRSLCKGDERSIMECLKLHPDALEDQVYPMQLGT